MFALFAAASYALSAVKAQDMSNSTCSVRLLHELSSDQLAVSLTQNGNLVVTADYHDISAYASVPCPSAADIWWIIDQQSGRLLAPVIGLANVGSSTFSILAVSNPSEDTASAIAFPDLTTPLPDDPASISQAAVRILNAWTGGAGLGVHVFGVTKDCYKCAMPYMYTLLPGQAVGASPSWKDWYMSGTEYGVYMEIIPVQDGVSPPSRLPTQFTSDGNTPVQGQTTRPGYTGWAGDLVLDEHGVYTLLVHDGGSVSWSVSTDVAGQDQWLPLLWAALALVGLGLLWHVLAFGVANAGFGTSWGNRIADDYAAVQAGLKKGKKRDVNLLSFFGFDTRIARTILADREKRGFEGDSEHLKEGLLVDAAEAGATAGRAATGSAAASVSTGRFRSLDTLRGMSLTIMCFVNYGAGSYSMLDHSAWNGLHLADLVFPWFVWMSGVSMAISFDSARKRGVSRGELSAKVTIRAIKLFALGLFLNGGATIAQWRIIGVLQYFAVSNLVVGNLEAWLHPDHAPASNSAVKGEQSKDLWLTLRRDVGQYWWQWAVMWSLLILYLCVQSALPLPDGCPTGYIGPGGLADNGQYYGLGCTGGAHRVVDYMIFGPNHIYHGVDGNGNAVSAATCAGPYQCDVHDPEGTLGWLTASWMVWMGLQAGRVLVNYKHDGAVEGSSGVDTSKLIRPYLSRLVTLGSSACLLGGALCSFAAEGGVLPINKNLWSPSFIAVLSGLGTLILAFLWLVIDHFRVWSGTPWRYVGMNSIAFYVLHETYASYLPFSIFVYAPGWGDPAGSEWYSHGEALGSNLTGVVCWMMVMRFLYLKGIFINF